MDEAIVDLRDTRCLRILDSLAVDVLLGSGVVVEMRVTPFDEVPILRNSGCRNGPTRRAQR